MPKPALTQKFHRAFVALAAARRAANAVDAHRAPSQDDLRTLGIDPAAFRNVTL